MIYDCAVIGAGIVGAAIARELSKYALSVCIIEKENDIACGTSKANSGIIHAGYDPVPGTLMAKLNVAGNAMYPELAKALNFDFKQIGSLVIAFSQEENASLESLKKRGEENGVPGLRILNYDELHSMEPNLAEQALCALYAPTAGIISPYQAVWAFAENAVENGTELFLNTKVHGLSVLDGVFSIHASRADIEARYVVNAAGLYADEINRMVGAEPFVTVPRRGEYCLIDKKCTSLCSYVLFQTPTSLGKGVLVTPTVDGNILIGPSAEDISDPSFTETTRNGQNDIWDKAQKTINDLPKRNIINSFAGVRSICYKKNKSGELTAACDFIIEEDSTVKRFISVGGIASPGLASAPAIGVYVADLLKKAGLTLKPKIFKTERSGIESFAAATRERQEELIKKNPLYGHIICRCEMITEAEIINSIHSVIGASDLDGIKRRTRSGMGRCQGGFCSPRITQILSRELHISMINVTKNGNDSYILNAQTRPHPEVL